MRVVVDAQLPRQLAVYLSSQGVDATHTLDLPNKNATSDSELMRYADREHRMVITKDGDFLDNYILDNRPEKLLIVSTGNISNLALIRIFEETVDTLKQLAAEHSVIEINEDEIQVHY